MGEPSDHSSVKESLACINLSSHLDGLLFFFVGPLLRANECTLSQVPWVVEKVVIMLSRALISMCTRGLWDSPTSVHMLISVM